MRDIALSCQTPFLDNSQCVGVCDVCEEQCKRIFCYFF